MRTVLTSRPPQGTRPTALDLTNATEVRFFMRLRGADFDTGTVCDIATPTTSGEVSVPMVPPQAGAYDAYFKVTWSSGSPDYIPSKGLVEIEVEDA